MDTNTIFILAVLVIGFAAVIFFLRKKSEEPKEDNQAFSMLLNQMNEMRNMVAKKMGE